jgi:DNA-binding NarL/FixJ family response regulator
MMVKSATKPRAAGAASGDAAARPLACLVVEDHTLIGQLLVGILRASPGIGSVSLATTAAEAIREAAETDLDLLILDLKLPDGDGLEVLRAVARRHCEVRCIVLSSAVDEFACPADLARHMAASIDKTAPLDELRLEVEAEVRRRLGGRLEGGRQDPATVLRPRELEVLQLIGKGMSSRQIAAALGISLHTANTHRRAITSKLGVSGAELVRLATVHNHTR